MRAIPTIVLVVSLFPATAQAQAVADGMSCQQAIAYYEQHGRISKRTSGGSTIPISDGVPASKRNNLRCSTTAINFRTADNPRCPVAYRCIPRSGR